MAGKIKLVQGDSRPQIKIVLLDEASGRVVNVSGASCLLRFRAVGESQILFTLSGVLLPGLETEEGFDMTSPYNESGAGGRVAFMFRSGDLNIPPGNYQGEVEVSFPDGSIQTVYEPLKFVVRGQF